MACASYIIWIIFLLKVYMLLGVSIDFSWQTMKIELEESFSSNKKFFRIEPFEIRLTPQMRFGAAIMNREYDLMDKTFLKKNINLSLQN